MIGYREFIVSIKGPKGGTQALVVQARNEGDARARILKAYPGATVNWIL